MTRVALLCIIYGLVVLITPVAYGDHIGISSGDWAKYDFIINIETDDKELEDRLQYLGMPGIKTTPVVELDTIRVKINLIDHMFDKVFGEVLFNRKDTQTYVRGDWYIFDGSILLKFIAPLNIEEIKFNKIGNTEPVITRELVKNGDDVFDAFKVDMKTSIIYPLFDPTSFDIDYTTSFDTHYTAYYEVYSGILLNLEYELQSNDPEQENTRIDMAIKMSDHGVSRITCMEGMAFQEGECVQKSIVGGGCLIATAAYGTELAPQVQALREIRDNTLMSTGSGSAFVDVFNDVYYSFSPGVADLQRENPMFKDMVKIGITPMLTTLSMMGMAEEGSESQVVGLGVAVIAMNVGMYVLTPALVMGVVRNHIRKCRAV